MPVKTVLVRQNDAQWMNDEIRLLIVKQNKLHKKAKQTNLKTDWGRFRKIINYLISRIRVRKIQSLKNWTRKHQSQTFLVRKSGGDWSRSFSTTRY